jgi:hypothetical protein
LLPASSDIVVSDIIKFLLVLTFDGVSLAVDHGIGRDNAVWSWIRLDNLELNWVHGRSHKEEIALLYGAIGLEEIRFKIHIEKVAANTLNCIIKRKNVNPLAVRDVSAASDRNNIGEADTEILPDHLVHANIGVVTGFVSKNDTHSVAALLTLQQDSVSAKQLKFLHLGRGQTNDRVIVICRIVNNKPIGAAFLGAKECVLHIGVFAV